MELFWSLYALCKQFPNAIGAVAGAIIGTLYTTWRIKAVILKALKDHLGLKQEVLNEVKEMRKIQEIDRSRIATLEREKKAHA